MGLKCDCMNIHNMSLHISYVMFNLSTTARRVPVSRGLQGLGTVV